MPHWAPALGDGRRRGLRGEKGGSTPLPSRRQSSISHPRYAKWLHLYYVRASGPLATHGATLGPVAEKPPARHRVEEVEGYVCERCDTHRTMPYYTDERLWKPIAGGYYASVDPGEVDPPLAPARYVCNSCGWETSEPRKDTGPWADLP
jgi:hypothetical protein